MVKKNEGDGIVRQAYTTSIDPELLKNFKVYCAVNEKRQNEVIEDLLKHLLKKEGGANGDSNR